MEPWIASAADAVAGRFEADLARLVAVSSPSGDVEGAETAFGVVADLLPDEAEIERVPCSTPDHAPDLIARLHGGGERRVLLLGHVDTVIPHEQHRTLQRDGERLYGSGSVDMKGGDVLAAGLVRALADRRPEYAEVALLLVCDEEWRTAPFAHVERFDGFDACLCFEAGQLAGAEEAVVVRRKAAATLRIQAHGRSAHSGSAPERGANALVALAEAARVVVACSDPAGPDRLTAVPTVLRCGDAFNVVPDAGELVCDLRAARLEAFDAVLAAVPAEVDGARLDSTFGRRWPGMDAEAATQALLDDASQRLGRPVVAAARGGASDASHFAAAIPLTVDGLGPRGGGAHAPSEHVQAASVLPRAQVAAAVVDAALTARTAPTTPSG